MPERQPISAGKSVHSICTKLILQMKFRTFSTFTISMDRWWKKDRVLSGKSPDLEDLEGGGGFHAARGGMWERKRRRAHRVRRAEVVRKPCTYPPILPSNLELERDAQHLQI